MNRNWYAVYTKFNCEKKVAAVLLKKGIENYYPLNRIVNFQGSSKIVYEPLLPSIVFVHINDAKIADIKKTGNIVNFVYWLGKPVMVKNDEIANMQYFTAEFSNIKLEKTSVDPVELGKITREPTVTGLRESPFSVKNTLIKLLLPSMGYMLVAEVEKSGATTFNHNFKRSNPVS